MARGDTVPVAPLRAAVLRYLDQHPDESFGSLAERLGWMHKGSSHGDTTRLQRRLGLKPNTNSGHKDRDTTSSGIVLDIAVQIAEAIHLDPVDVGL